MKLFIEFELWFGQDVPEKKKNSREFRFSTLREFFCFQKIFSVASWFPWDLFHWYAKSAEFNDPNRECWNVQVIIRNVLECLPFCHHNHMYSTRSWQSTQSKFYISYLYRYVPPYRVEFLRRFGLKTDIHFAHFGMESRVVFEGTTGVYERNYRFNPACPIDENRS